ncbi:hypothetical protein GCM10010271_68340 [Streptomyces kurssanovii]|nr:hypothetical protein GCM10010271_68340 [Streptomyces kurssanovii]
MKHRTVSIAVVAALVFSGATACGNSEPSSNPSPQKAAPSSLLQTPSTPTPRELKAGQTISVTSEDGPADITLLATARTTSIGTAKPDAGEQFLVYTMQVKNLSETEWDTYWLGSPRWVGSNGEAVNPTFVAGPTDPELIPYSPFSSTPEPRPGEHVKATQVLQVPNTAGTLQFEDDSGNRQFSIVFR